MSTLIINFYQDYQIAKILYSDFVYANDFIINPFNGEKIHEIVPEMLQQYNYNWETFQKEYPGFPIMCLKQYLYQFVIVDYVDFRIKIEIPLFIS